MISLDDKRWVGLKGGYKVEFDPRPHLLQLEADNDAKSAWAALWENLHHQGDVGEASYAAVPHLVRAHRDRNRADWNLYALVATIELARDERTNPPLPAWLEEDYKRSIQELAMLGSSQIMESGSTESVRAILSVIAIAKGARAHAKLLLEFSEDEIREAEPRIYGP
jgi:hypothetical protein